MCGVAGTIGHFDQHRVGAVAAMNRAQEHRGPDDEGTWSWNTSSASGSVKGVAFGHRRLSIVDLSPLGHQPMIDEDSGCVICFNGEVFNFHELRDDLLAEGVTFKSTGDTEVLLKGYARWGEKVLTRCRGMFGVAIWDPRKQAVLLARDRLGIKPVYYTTVDQGPQRAFYFASEVRALLATGHVPRRIDRVGLSTYLWNGVLIGPRTLIEGVHLLPAGMSMWIDIDGTHTAPQRFWQLPASRPAADQAKARAELAEELERAIRMRLIADVPLGVFLSGGIDSSAIATIATRQSKDAVKTYNISFDEARYDESPYARAVAKALGTDHHEVRLTGAIFRSGLTRALEAIDQPTFDGINTYFVSKAVREAGLTVALAGTGGDELYGGYSSFVDVPRAAKVARALSPLPTQLLNTAANVAARLKTGAPGEVPPQTRWGKLPDVFATRGKLLNVYQVSYGLFTRAFLAQLAIDQHASDGLDHGLPKERYADLERITSAEPGLHAVSMMELSFFLGERLLRDTDAASMASQLEVRVPLIDHVVIEKVAAIDDATRFSPLGRKQLLRDIGLKGLDPAIFERKKAGFELPIDVWSRQELRDDLDKTLTDPTLCARVGLRADAVARLWRAFQAGAPGLYWSRIWSLYVLLWWCRKHDVALA